MSWEELRDVQKIRPSSGAFAALLGSGKAGGWSNMKELGGSLTVKHLEGFFFSPEQMGIMVTKKEGDHWNTIHHPSLG